SLIVHVEDDHLLLAPPHGPRRPSHIHIPFEYRECSLVGRSLDAEMCAVIELNFFTRKIQREIVALSQPVDVSLALRKVDFRDALAGVTQAKAAELDHGIRSEANGAAIFEFNLGAAGVAGPEPRPLRDWKVQKPLLESHSCILVDLDRSL